MEVAHDMQLQVGRYISSELHLLNSYDTWHGKINDILFEAVIEFCLD